MRLRPLGASFGGGVYKGAARTRGFVQHGVTAARDKGSARAGQGRSCAHPPREQGVQLVESEAPSPSPGTMAGGGPRGRALSESGAPTPPPTRARLSGRGPRMRPVRGLSTRAPGAGAAAGSRC